MKNKLCPYPWVQLSVEPNGNLRVCCYGGPGKDVKDEEGQLISIKDLDSVDSALNHPSYKKLRNDMIRGQFPSFCDTCLKLESSGGCSPRTSQLSFYKKTLEGQLQTMEKDGAVASPPFTLELTLGNTCNLKCRMCSPFFSSRLKEDFDQLGMPYNKKEVAEIESFWSSDKPFYPFLEDALKYVKRIVFLGGEPLLSPYHERILRHLIEINRSQEVALSYNTNLTTVPDRLLKLWESFSQIHLDVSLEGKDEINDFIRSGSSFKKIDLNLDKVHQKLGERLQINICTVLQAYNFLHIGEWLDFLKDWKDFTPLIPNFIYLDFPSYLSSKVLPLPLREKGIEAILQKVGEYERENLSDLEKLNLQSLEGFLSDLKNSDWDEKGYFDFLLYNKKVDALRKESVVEMIPGILSPKK